MTKARDLANSAAAFSAVSATELGYVDGVTSAIQTQLDAKIAKTLTSTTGDMIYASAANTPARLGIGSSAQILTVASGIPSWATPAASASGLTLISSTSFSASSAHSVNNCFSATYDNYRILIKLSAQTGTNTDFTMRLRVSGTDATTNYISQRLYNAATTVGADINSSGTDDWLLHTISTTNPTAMSISSIDIFDPFPATPTQATNIAIGYFGGNNYGTFMALVNSNSTSYDGFSLIPVSGTVSGTVRVYGYQNS